MAKGHHVLFEKNNWLGPQNSKLRNRPGLIIPIERDAHDALHRAIETVVTPSYRMGSAILAAYRDNPDDHIRSVENLIYAVDESIRSPRVKPLEAQLGQLMIASLEIQLPFIREGIIRRY